MCLFINLSRADELYKIRRPDGSIIYSSKKTSNNAEVLKLPKLNREQSHLGSAQEIQSSSPSHTSISKTCSGIHGGVRCEEGPDLDGSVICVDGYKDALLRFNFSCRATRLSVVTASVTGPETIKIVVRNERAIEAVGVEVTVKLDDGNSNQVQIFKATGSSLIKPSQAGDYLVNYPKLNRNLGSFPVDKIEITCGNCQ